MTVEAIWISWARIKGGGGGRTGRNASGEVKEKVSIQNTADAHQEPLEATNSGWAWPKPWARSEVLILDEPTVGLDPNQIIEVRQLIKSRSGNHTIILSTHILPSTHDLPTGGDYRQRQDCCGRHTENLTRQLQDRIASMSKLPRPEPSITGKIKEIEGVLRVESHKLDGSDAFSYSVETELKRDVRGRLARKLSKAASTYWRCEPSHEP